MGKKSGKHLMKKRRTAGSRMVLVFAGVALIYFAGQIYGALSGNIETVSATHVTVDDALSVTGCFIRDEQIVAGTTGDTVEHVVHSGERVHVGSRLAVEYADQTALDNNRKLDALNAQISLLQAALQSTGDLADAGKLDQLISMRMQTLAAQTGQGSMTDLSDSSKALRQLVLRRMAGGQDQKTLQSDLDVLKQQQASLQGTISTHTTVISAPSGGYFSGTVDGYETVLTTDMLDKLDVDTFHAKLAAPATADAKALGKILRGFYWHLGAVVNKNEAQDFAVGHTYALRFAQISGDVPVTLEAIRPQENGNKVLLLFKGSVFDSELVSMRQQVVDIIRGTYTGIKVPKSAIRTQGNTLGVYTLSGSVSRFKKIVPLYEGDTYYVIEQGNTADTGVVVQDNIIVKARGLEDKKVVKK